MEATETCRRALSVSEELGRRQRAAAEGANESDRLHEPQDAGVQPWPVAKASVNEGALSTAAQPSASSSARANDERTTYMRDLTCSAQQLYRQQSPQVVQGWPCRQLPCTLGANELEGKHSARWQLVKLTEGHSSPVGGGDRSRYSVDRFCRCSTGQRPVSSGSSRA